MGGPFADRLFQRLRELLADRTDRKLQTFLPVYGLDPPRQGRQTIRQSAIGDGSLRIIAALGVGEMIGSFGKSARDKKQAFYPEWPDLERQTTHLGERPKRRGNSPRCSIS